jgi:hypothetical protein
MKKALSALSVVLLFICIAGCKKNSSGGPKETVLSQVFINGKLQLDYEYNDKQQLSKITEYDPLTGKPEYSQAFTYDSKGRLDDILDYNANGKLTAKEEYHKDLAGNFTKRDFFDLSGTDSGKVVSRVEYTYKEKRIIKEAWVDLVTGKEYAYRKFAWYVNGNMKSSEYYGSLTPVTLWWKSEYSPAGDSLPATLVKHAAYPVNFWNWYFVAEEIHSSTEAAAGTPTDYTEFISNRKYNEEGLLIEQTIIKKHTVPILKDVESKMKYVYKQI